MTDDALRIHPDLRLRLEQVAGHCRRARAVVFWKRFGWYAFALSCIFTFVLALVSPDGYGATAVVGVYLVSLLVSLWVCVIRPSLVPVTLKQVAILMDERHPELENRVATAVELSSFGDEYASPWIIGKFLDETTPLVRNTSFDDLTDVEPVLKQGIAALSILLAATLVVVGFGNLWLPGLRFVLPGETLRYASLPFTVDPGDVRVRRGDNQMVWVRSNEPDRKVLVRWRVENGFWEVSEAELGTSDTVHYHQFANVQRHIEYQVVQGRRRSEVFRITAWTPPEVESIDLSYHYPPYLKRESEEVPNGGNITAMEGTVVDLKVWVNKKLSRADLVLDEGGRIPLVWRDEGLWAGQIKIERDDRYRVELADLEGAESEYNPEYRITARRDKPPEIRISFPRGDNEVTLLDEVPFDFQVTDDFGFNEFGIQYEVAGREPVRVALNSTDENLLEAKGHHQIELEGFGLEPGDFVTWTVWAKDAKPDRNIYELMGDPYFLEIRPFKRRYREAMSGAGGGGGGGGGQDLAAQQKDIIIATWNLRRKSTRLRTEEFENQRDVIVEAQEENLKIVAQAGGMMGQGGAELMELRVAMSAAVEALEMAALPDPRPELSEATQHEQEAFRIIRRMMPDEAQVRQDNSQGGGAGGGSERPDISALEMDRYRNFYGEESLTQEQQQAADDILDEIKELARRQQGVNDEIDRLISEYQNAKTEEERERIRRKLERLEEEMRDNLERLDQTRQDLASGDLNNEQSREALDSMETARRQMNRSLEQLQQDKMQQARASGSRAVNALNDIRDHLQQFTREAASRQMRELQDRMEKIKERQSEIAREVDFLQEQHSIPSFDGSAELEASAERVQESKEALAEEFVEMMDEASELAERARETQELMSRELGDWLRETSREGILEDIEESKPYVRYGVWDAAAAEEEKIARKLDKAAEGLEAVAQNLVDDDVQGMQRALEELDRLLEETEAREQRAAAGEEGEPSGQEGSEGSESDPEDNRGQQGTRSASSANGDARGGAAGRDAMMREFVQDDYADWVDSLRRAESLLPYDNAARGRIARVREGIERIRRDWRQRALAPRYDLFLEMAVEPLEEAAAELQREIERRLDSRDLVVADEGEVPQKYKKLVADYFKDLSEAEGAR